jgi:RNA polymerase sigma factor (sigma-70 family)
MNHVDEELLLYYAQKNDQLAQQMLYNRFAKILVFEASRMVGDEEDAKDIVHDFFVDFFAKKHYTRIRANVGGYLYKSIRYSCMMIMKRKKYREKSMEHYKSFQDLITNVIPGEGREVREAFYRALDTLPKQPARAAQLYVEADLRRKEVALEMGLSDNTVKTHLAVATKVLRRRMLELR